MKRIGIVAMVALLTSAATAAPVSAPSFAGGSPPKASPPEEQGCALPGLRENDNSERLVLDSQDAPLSERQVVFRAYESCAQTGDPDAQDLVGSLYWMGQALPGALVSKDRAKAILYLSNAAAHGMVLDMAKMAELEYTAADYQSSLVWAVLFTHYESLLATGTHTGPNGYAAELLARIYAKLPEKKRGAAIEDANNFIVQYDAAIRSHVQHAKEGAPTWMNTKDNLVEIPMQPVWKGSVDMPFAAMVEYLVAFNPDGTVSNAWMLDALPDIEVGRMLRDNVTRWKVSPSNDPELRYLRVPIFFDDQRYEVKQAQ